MQPEEVGYARALLQSIECGLSKLENGSTVEDGYLSEKIGKLYRLQFED